MGHHVHYEQLLLFIPNLFIPRWLDCKSDHVAGLGFQFGIGGELERLDPCGWMFHFRQIRATVANEIPNRAASSRDDQCVTPNSADGFELLLPGAGASDYGLICLGAGQEALHAPRIECTAENCRAGRGGRRAGYFNRDRTDGPVEVGTPSSSKSHSAGPSRFASAARRRH